METITQKMQQDHRHCDELFIRTEELIANEQWDEGLNSFKDFRKALIHHLNMEEQVLFAEFEKATGSTAGPTQVMRSEHEQMRDLLSNMAQAVEQRNLDDFLGLSETLLIMMQQHNTKEENILYPMTDQVLAQRLPDLLDEMDQVGYE
ncbi:MAG: hemerythrin domain-containing protein [Gammaproteobacteria bacterium]|nr:MAG: hemerythrin domain-containing protein [Gammaproteobacteria bacterium]